MCLEEVNEYFNLILSILEQEHMYYKVKWSLLLIKMS